MTHRLSCSICTWYCRDNAARWEMSGKGFRRMYVCDACKERLSHKDHTFIPLTDRMVERILSGKSPYGRNG